MLFLSAGRGELGALLKRLRGIEVHGVEPDPMRRAVAERVLDTAYASIPGEAGIAAPAPFDAVALLLEPGMDPEVAPVQAVRALLRIDGLFLLGVTSQEGEDRAVAHARTAGLGLYNAWRIEQDGVRVLVFVRPEYNPLDHAQNLFEAGKPDWSFEALALIPGIYLTNDETRLNVRAEMHVSLLAYLKQNPSHKPLDYFDKAQEVFHQLVADRPDFAPAYQCQAEFWRLMGDPGMSRRLLASVQQVYPTEAVARQLASFPQILRRAAEPELPPEWEAKGDARPRVLFVTHPRLHYGLDVVYDGLCTVLGEAQVTDFPHKPSLHGAPPAEYKNYPCTFDRGGTARTLDEVIDELRRSAYDFVIYGDCERGLPYDTASAIAESVGDTPVFLYDALDAALDTRARVLEYAAFKRLAGYLKREMLRCVDYGPDAFPLPFGYPDERVHPAPEFERAQDFFWAGHRQSGLRRLFLERVEARLGRTLDVGMSQEEYLARLRDSRMAMNCFGFGFDTVRYWEIPAQGAMLLSEQLPIRIPHDFEDGVNAAIFRDVEELDTRVAQHLADPGECARLAQAGYAHLKRYHTGSARARQCLGYVAQVLGW